MTETPEELRDRWLLMLEAARVAGIRASEAFEARFHTSLPGVPEGLVTPRHMSKYIPSSVLPTPTIEEPGKDV